MKKLLLILVTIALAFTALTACQPEDDGIKSVGFLVPGGEGFLAMLAGGLQASFEADGWEWNIGVADFDSSKQIEQIENMIVLKVDVLIVMAVDPTSLGDVLQDAMDEGIKVINFTTDPGVGDMFIGSDEGLIGETVAEMASNWIDSAFAEAANGSVNVAVFKFNGTPEAVDRSNGLATITDNSKVNLVTTIEVENTRQAALAAMENLMTTNPEINVVLTYNTAMSLGVNDYATSETSALTNLALFGVFGSDNDPEVLAAILASADNSSVLRGATQLGGSLDDTYALVLGYANDLYNGVTVPSIDIAQVFPITEENAADYQY